MTVRYASHVNRKTTPQSEAIPGATQVQNNAGGYVYAVDKWARLTRFLVLGSDGGTYYVREKALTRDNAKVVDACLVEDAAKTLTIIRDVSVTGRAPKNDPAIFALAIAASSPTLTVRALALAILPDVCRIPTHLFHFLAYCKAMRGWSRGLRTAVAHWYQRWTPDQLAFELVKYQARDGWAHKDALRLSHAKLSQESQAALRWAVGADVSERVVTRKNRLSVGRGQKSYSAVGDLPSVIAAFEAAKTATPTEVVRLITAHGLSREMVPTDALNDRDVWAALLVKMPMHAMVRNLAKMTAVGLLVPLSDAVQTVTTQLANQNYITKSRLHPMAILNALRVYQSGHGDKGSLTWTPVPQIVDALDAAFYLAFGNVTPTNKRLMLALDVSGSMGSPIAGTGLTCREAAAAMALVTAHVEPRYLITGFMSGSSRTMHYGYSAAIEVLEISARQRLDDVVRYMAGLSFGGTDCALPMVYATEQKLDVDAFAIYTDNETWAGNVHPSQALRAYRSQSGIAAKEVVVGMTATEFTIADPKDPLTLDVVGFDMATPNVISEFVTG